MSSLNKLLVKKNKEKKGTKDKSIPTVKTPDIILHSVKNVPLSEIKENENQPRKEYSSDKIDSLATSIKEKGLIQPIVVKTDGSGYLIVSGHRRYKAYAKLGEKNIPAIVKYERYTTDDLTELAIVENLQRDDLNAYEIATSIKELQGRGKNVKDIGSLTGYKKSMIYNYVNAYIAIENELLTKEELIKKGIFPMIGKLSKEKKVKAKESKKTSTSKKFVIKINDVNKKTDVDGAIQQTKQLLSQLKEIRRSL